MPDIAAAHGQLEILQYFFHNEDRDGDDDSEVQPVLTFDGFDSAASGEVVWSLSSMTI